MEIDYSKFDVVIEETVGTISSRMCFSDVEHYISYLKREETGPKIATDIQQIVKGNPGRLYTNKNNLGEALAEGDKVIFESCSDDQVDIGIKYEVASTDTEDYSIFIKNPGFALWVYLNNNTILYKVVE